MTEVWTLLPWKHVDAHFYRVCSEDFILEVHFAKERWVSRVFLRAEEIHRSEHDMRDQAMCIAEQATRRACKLRRFEENPPKMPAGEADAREERK